MHRRQLNNEIQTHDVYGVDQVTKASRSDRALIVTVMLCLLSVAGLAQTNISQTINATYNNINSGFVIPNDFIGISFETAAVTPGNGSVTGNMFSPSDSYLINIFQQMGIKNLRIGGSSVNTATPTHADIDALFGFANAAGVKVIYSLPIDSPATASNDASIAKYIWVTGNYSPLVQSFAIGNEEDWIKSDLAGYIGSATQSGSWLNFENTISSSAPGAMFSGPDSGNYTGTRLFTGSLCGSSVTNITWSNGFTHCANAQNWSPLFNLVTQHHYIGGAACGSASTCTSASQGTQEMLSSGWVTGTSPTTELCGTATTSCKYYPYDYVYQTYLSGVVSGGFLYRMTELNEYVTGVLGASNAFTGGLWVLDVMHWLADHHASGVNFHNNQWIPSDTIIPGDLVNYSTPYNPTQSYSCSGTGGSCGRFTIVPKGYGYKAFDLSGHGYTIGVSALENDMPDGGSLDTYAVGSGQDLYVTLINKTNATNSGDTANVTINIGTGDAPFVAASVSSLKFWNGNSSAPSDPTQKSALIGTGSIDNSGTQWAGYWTAQPAMTSGSEIVSVPPAQAMIVHFHAPSNYVGPIQINQNGALEMFTTDSTGNVYHQWQKAANLNTEPNSGVSDWSNVTENLSGAIQTANPSGDIAVAKNLDNTLQVFIPAGTNVLDNRQLTPGGGWNSSWTSMDMGTSSGITHLKAGRNADGSLTVFGLDSGGHLWYATENAPGVAWSSWAQLGTQIISAGYAVGENLSGRLEVFGVNGGNVYHIWQTLGNSWSNWSEIAANGGQTLKAWLQVARDITGDLYLFALDSNGNVWSNWQSSPSGNWQTNWTELPVPTSPIQQGFVAGQNANGRFELFGVGSDTNLYHMWVTTNGNWTANWVTIANNAPAGGFDPHLMVGNTNDGRLQIFAIGKNSPNDLFTNWQGSISGAWTNWADYGSSTSGLIFYPGQP